MLHLDRFQNRKDGQDEAAVNRLRAEFCDRFRTEKGVQLGFIMPISNQSLSDLDILAPFFIKNADVISSITFTVQRDSLAAKTPVSDPHAKIDNILSEIKRALILNIALIYPNYFPRISAVYMHQPCIVANSSGSG